MNTLTGRIKREAITTNAKLPILGKIKCGEMTEGKGGKSHPRSLDYFIATGKFAHYFDEVFKDKPQRIPIAFISDRVQDVCNQSFVLRGGDGRLWGSGDGETFRIFNPNKGVEDYEVHTRADSPNIMNRMADKVGAEWKETLELTFIIPSIRSVVGQWRFTTKGAASSIPSIIGAFDFVQAYGTVVRVPFDLVVEKVKSQKPNDSSLFPVVSLIPNLSTDHLESLSTYLSEGHNLKELGTGMLTQDVFDRLPRALAEPPTPSVKESPKEQAEEETPFVELITDEQYAQIIDLMVSVDKPAFSAWVVKQFGVPVAGLTEANAVEVIKALKTKQVKK